MTGLVALGASMTSGPAAPGTTVRPNCCDPNYCDPNYCGTVTDVAPSPTP